MSKRKTFAPRIVSVEQRPGLRRHDDFTVRGLVNVACAIDVTNRELLVDDNTGKRATEAFFSSAVQCYCHGRKHNLVQLFSTKLK